MSNRRHRFGKHALLSCSALVPLLLAAGPAQAQAVNVGGTGNFIAPDGRTGTSVHVNGNVADIHTNTVRGSTGFNSFSRFEVGGGNTVNLHLPNKTKTLVNIVRDGPVVVEGTVNALKDGTIGGHVVFSDSYGFVLGKDGVINTGRLTVNTPTREFLDGTIDSRGNIDTGRAERLISGDVPISPDGSVVIKGRVNAYNGIDIHARDIDIDSESKLKRHREDFESTVNTKGGGARAGALVVRNGRISLVAAGKVKVGGKIAARAKSSKSAKNGAGKVSIKAAETVEITETAHIEAVAAKAGVGFEAVSAAVSISGAGGVKLAGTVEALGAAGTKGGRIDVTSATNISLASTARLDASGAGEGSSGGSVYVVAANDLTAADGAALVARGAGDTDGGFAELSGHKTLNLGQVAVDLRSEGAGKAGKLLIDPEDITIDNDTMYVRGAAGSIIDNIGELVLEAENSITITGTGRINTSLAGHDSLNITITAKTITAQAGSEIIATATGGFTSGNITLNATDSKIIGTLQATSSAKIDLAGKIAGKTVTITASSTAISSATDAILNDPLGMVSSLGELAGSPLAGLVTGLSGGYVGADSTARVDVRSSANIQAEGDLSLVSTGVQTASNLGINVTLLSPVQMTAYFGLVDAETVTEVHNGANLSSGGNIKIEAKNEATLGVSASSFALQGAPVSNAIAAGVALVDTKAIVNDAAVITNAESLTVRAENTNDFSVAATTMSFGSALAGLSIAVHVSDASATARIGSDVGSAADPIGDVNVIAISDTLQNKTSSSTTVGDNAIVGLIRDAIPNKFSVQTLAQKLGPLSPLGELSPAEALKGGLAFTFAKSDLSANASIAAGVLPTGPETKTPPANHAPVIRSDGNIAVFSSAYLSPVRVNAISSVASNAEGTSQSPTAEQAVGVAISIGILDNISHATIGRYADITAANVGLMARSETPITTTYAAADSVLDTVLAIKGALNTNGGLANNVATSYAGTDVEGKDLAIAASVNFLGISNDTLAWVGSNVKIQTTAASDPNGWVATVGSGDQRGTEDTYTFRTGLDVQAYTFTETLNIGGVPAWLIVIGGTAPSDPDGKSGGGSLNLNLFSSDTVAGIGAGADITSAAQVTVDAETIDSIIAIAPSSGSGGGFGINGLMSYLGITNNTHASISHLAKVAAQQIDVLAHQDTLIVSVAGALSRSTGSSVGLAAAWSNYETHTSAFIGNNDELVKDTDNANFTAATAGDIKANALNVKASTTGANYTLSVAAALSSPNDGEPGIKDKITNKIDGTIVGPLSGKLARSLVLGSAANSKVKGWFAEKAFGGLEKLSDKLTEPPADGQTRDFSMAAAGSVSGVTTSFDTKAYIDDAVITRHGAAGAVAIRVDATNDILISTTSGSASVALAGQDSSNMSAAVAGAVAIALTDNQTQAWIQRTTVTQAGATRVSAISSGQQIVLGLGIAANTNANKSFAIAGSTSVGGSSDSVNASIHNSSLSANSLLAASERGIKVMAYQNTDIGIGGLAVSVATKGTGIGLGLTVTTVTDNDEENEKAASARVVNSDITNYGDLVVDAVTVSRILGGAGSVGVAPNGLALNGSFVISEVSATTLAEITGVNAADKIDVTGDVSVTAGSERRADVENEINAVIVNKNIDAGFDFSKTVLEPGDADTTTGATTFSVAGLVGVGENSAGLAFNFNHIAHKHQAFISGGEVEADGSVTVSAIDKSAVFGTAAGVSVGTGKFAGSGSIVVSVINNETRAKISGIDTKVTAGTDIVVQSSNDSYVGGGAGAVAVSAAGSGVGLSIINNTIANETHASVERATLKAGRDVVFGADSKGKLLTFAVSVGVGKVAGVGGSVANSVANNNASAKIQGASVEADNNVAVEAYNNDEVHSVAGAVGIGKNAGVGISTAVNVVSGETIASIESMGGTDSTIIARAEGDGRDVDSGEVADAFDYSALDLLGSIVTLTPDMSNTTRNVNGVAVVAASKQAVGTSAVAVSAALSGGSAAVGFSPVVNVLGGKTEAKITDANINVSNANNAEADVAVIASSNTFDQNFLIGGAGGGGFAGAAGLIVNTMERETTALVSGATIGSTAGGVGNTLVRARGTMDSFNVVLGLAGGNTGAGAGSFAVNVFDATTKAQLTGGHLTGKALDVEAYSKATYFGLAGVAAFDVSAAAVAGGINVAVDLGTTSALIGSDDKDTEVDLTGKMRADAHSIDSVNGFAIGGAVSGGVVGIAGMFNLGVVESDTIASVNRLTDSSVGSAEVKAQNESVMLPITGALGVSIQGAGIGAALNVMATKGQVEAEIINSDFISAGSVDVSALAKREINMYTVTFGGGLYAGIGASIGVIVVGNEMSDDARAELGETLTKVNEQANQNPTSQLTEADNPANRDSSNDTRKDVVKNAMESQRQDTVSARIVNMELTGGNTSVTAESQIYANNVGIGAGVGAVGGGAALGFTFVDQNVWASASGDLTVASLTAKATSKNLDTEEYAVNVHATAAAGGLGGGMGAAVAVGDIDSDVKAAAGGNVTLTGAGKAVNIEASDKTAIKTEAIGASVAGGVAIGASIAVSSKNSTVTAEIADNAVVTDAGQTTVKAEAFGKLDALARAGAGGITGAGVGAGGTAQDTSTVIARVGKNATVSAASLTVLAKAVPQAFGEAVGVAVGAGAAVGIAIGEAKVNLTLTAEIGDNADVTTTTGNIGVKAEVDHVDNDYTAEAKSAAGSGSVYAALNGTGSIASTITNTTARIGAGAKLQSAAAITVEALSSTRQYGFTTGISASLGASLGANIVDIDSDTTTTAKVEDGGEAKSGTLMTVKANSEDYNNADVIAGAGALVSGIAAEGSTNSVSNTSASLGGDVDVTTDLAVLAEQKTAFDGKINGVNIGLVGGGGNSSLSHDVNSTVSAKVNDNAGIVARNVDVHAYNTSHKFFIGETPFTLLTGGVPTSNGDDADWNVDSRSGGLLTIPAGGNDANIKHTTTTTLGKNADIVLRYVPNIVSTADFQAYNEVVYHDKAMLDTGGAIQVADVATNVNVDSLAASVIFDEGSAISGKNANVSAAAWDSAHIDVRADASTYGIAGAPIGSAEVTYKHSNTVEMRKDAAITANGVDSLNAGVVSLAAGTTPSLEPTKITLISTVNLFNGTVVPIDVPPGAEVHASGDGKISIAAPTIPNTPSISAAGDINLYASKGLIDIQAEGTAKNLYEAALEGIVELFGGDASFETKHSEVELHGLGIVEIEGAVLTGIDRRKTLTVEYAQQDTASCTVSAEACLIDPVEGEIGYTFTDGIEIGTEIVERLEELRALLADYQSDPVAKGAFAAEIKFLEAKLIAAGFSKDGVPGPAYSQSPYEQATELIAAYKTALTSYEDGVITNAGTAATQAGNGITGATGLGTNGSAIQTALTNYDTSTDGINADLQALAGYDFTTAIKNANDADIGVIQTKLTSNAGLNTQIQGYTDTINTRRADIETARTEINTQKTLISQKQTLLQGLEAGSALAQTLQGEILTAQQTISTKAALIDTALADIKSASDSIAGLKTTLDDNTLEIRIRQEAIRTRSGGSAALGSEIVSNYSGISGTLGTQFTSVDSNGGTVAAAQTAFADLPDYFSTAAGNYEDMRADQYALVASLPTLSDDPPAVPTTGQIRVDDTVVRLGDINIVADQLTGSGILSAPGDAAIIITNKTANNLLVGNLTVDANSGGRLRYNGALMNDNATIDTMNWDPDDDLPNANFTIVTAQTQGDNRPAIIIRNEYNSNSLSYYDPALNPDDPSFDQDAADANNLYYKTRPFFAPSLTIASGTAITNLTGSVTIHSEQGDIFSNGAIHAGSAAITAKNGDFVQSFTYGFQHIKGDPRFGIADGTGIVVNGAVSISARYLNINGVIQSGMANRFVTLSDTILLTGTASQLGVSQTDVDTWEDDYREALQLGQNPSAVMDVPGKTGLQYRFSQGDTPGRFEFNLAYAETNHATETFNTIPSEFGKTDAEMLEVLGVAYDVAERTFVIDGAEVRGGYIQVYGQIINTSSDQSGKLRVLDGFGQIQITNNSTRDVIIGNLNTGADPEGNGRGVQGVIDITDIRRVTSLTAADLLAGKIGDTEVIALKTRYTREADTNGNYRVVQNSTIGEIDADGNFVADDDQTGYGTTYGSDRTDSYDPQAGLRFVYFSGENSSTRTVTHYSGSQFLGTLITLPPSDATVESTYSYVLDRFVMDTGMTVVVDTGLTGTALDTESHTYSGGNTEYTTLDSWTECTWWTACVHATYHYILAATTPNVTITRNSMKADYAIGIDFIGNDNGVVKINSNSANTDVRLAGVISNSNGTTTITSIGNILRHSAGANIVSKNVNLTANKNIGGLGAGEAIRLSLRGGTLDARAFDGNVVLDANTNVKVGLVKASGDASQLEGRVVLTATGSIEAADNSSKIEGPRVELTSKYGSIGSIADQLTVNTGYTTDESLRPFGDPALDTSLNYNGYYGLEASAAGNIGIKAGVWSGNADGTILVDRVVAGGDIKLSTPGAILDNNPIQSIDSRTYGELLEYWDSLGLTAGAENDAKIAAQIEALEHGTTIKYKNYWDLRAGQADGGAVYDPNYAYHVSEQFAEQFGRAMLRDNPALTDADIAAALAEFEQRTTDRYHQLHSEVGGLTASFDDTYQYELTQDQKDDIAEHSVWSERQLAFSVSAGALKTVTGTNPVIKAANVEGRTVSLEAGKHIGETAGTVTIPTNIDPSTLTNAQKIALATAERGDFSYSSTTKTLSLSLKRPLNFQAGTRLNAAVNTGGSFAYLSSMGDARLGDINVPGELRLKVRGSISNQSPGSPGVAAGSYILEAQHGGIGEDGAPLRLAPHDTTGTSGNYEGTIVARAAKDVVIDVEDDANVDTIYSRALVDLAAEGDIRNANGDALLNILGEGGVVLSADGSIGSADDRLNIGNGLGGHVDVVAGGALYLHGVHGNLLTLHDADVGGLIDLTALGNLAISGNVEGGGSFKVDAATLRMLNGSAVTVPGVVAITTAGDAQITNLATSDASNDAIRIIAGGRILAGTANGRIDLEADNANGRVYLKAENGIGDRRVENTDIDDATETDELNHLRVRTARIAAETTNGEIAIELLNGISDSLFETTNGEGIDLIVNGGLVSDYIIAPNGYVRVRAQGDVSVNDIEVGTSALFEAPNLLVADLVHTGAGKLNLSVVGANGGVAEGAVVNVTAPNGILMPKLHVADSVFTTDAPDYEIQDGFVPGTMRWIRPQHELWMNNILIRPVLGPDVQLYDQDFAFMLKQVGNQTTTTAFIVRFEPGNQVIHIDSNGNQHLGSNLVQDLARIVDPPPEGVPDAGTEEGSLFRRMVTAISRLFSERANGPVSNAFDGPAVNLQGAYVPPDEDDEDEDDEDSQSG